MLSKPGKLWSNFWGAIGQDGYYVRAPDYIDIVKNVRRGVWNSPYVSCAYLIKSSTLTKMAKNPFYSERFDRDMIFAANNRDKVCMQSNYCFSIASQTVTELKTRECTD